MNHKMKCFLPFGHTAYAVVAVVITVHFAFFFSKMPHAGFGNILFICRLFIWYQTGGAWRNHTINDERNAERWLILTDWNLTLRVTLNGNV